MSKVWAPTLSLSRVRKELPALMAIQTVLSLWYAAPHDNRKRIQVRCGYTCRGVKILLISTYELGRQPFGLASPAAWLRKRGHEVTCLDLSRQALSEQVVREAALIAFYVPMHTATRLTLELLEPIRRSNPSAHLCAYGLYAPLAAETLSSLGVESLFGGEFEQALVDLAEHLSGLSAFPQIHPLDSNVSLGRLRFVTPDRSDLPLLKNYAHLVMPAGEHRLVGYTEASRGCKHLCRHCPIVPVYNGVFRIVDRDVVLADVRQQVAAGAQHISFGDPDFFNGIRHAMELVEAFHSEFPTVTYDVTIKIEHLRKQEQHLARLRDTGCLFVISAVESVNEEILERLDKGHTREDFLYVARKFRELGMTLHPTFVPFTPWTTMEGYLELLRVLAVAELIGNVAPIQLGIRLLIPKGSRLLELEEVRRGVGAFDAESLVYPWRNTDARVDALSDTVQSIAAEADRKKESRVAAFARIWESAHAAAGVVAPELRVTEGCGVPFLSEPWYCCAEPTRDQLVAIGGAALALAPEKVVAADGFV